MTSDDTVPASVVIASVIGRGGSPADVHHTDCWSGWIGTKWHRQAGPVEVDDHGVRANCLADGAIVDDAHSFLVHARPLVTETGKRRDRQRIVVTQCDDGAAFEGVDQERADAFGDLLFVERRCQRFRESHQTFRLAAEDEIVLRHITDRIQCEGSRRKKMILGAGHGFDRSRSDQKHRQNGWSGQPVWARRFGFVAERGTRTVCAQLLYLPGSTP